MNFFHFLYILLSTLVVAAETNNKCIYQPSFKKYALRSSKQPNPKPSLDENDYKTLLDLKDFAFTINPNICYQSSPLLLILVTSATQNIERRHAIRTTWGQSDSFVRIIFIVGTAADTLHQKAIELESIAHGDIVQGNFIDSNQNLTYKTLMAMKYVTYHCLNTSYVLKTTDDVFVNTPMLKTYLVNDMSPDGAQNYLHCHVMKDSPIVRDKSSKWFVSLEELSGEVYPPYCNGVFTLQSTDVAIKLYVEGQKNKYFSIEDVFLYKMVLSNIPEIQAIHIGEFSLSDFDRSTKTNALDNKNFLFTLSSMSIDQILEFWTYVSTGPVRTSIYDYSEYF